ncbi:hypothetical protein HY838_01535 [Candidatus Azambacteria bacterium]|nr:hypothetical protein [Candidatus Azambacteria bacterium]
MPSSKYWRFKTIKKEERKRNWKFRLFYFASSAILIIAIWALFFSSFFKITEVKLPKNDIIAADDIYKLTAASAPLHLGENLFILSKNRLNVKLAAAFPELTNISISKKPLHGLAIDFEKRTQIGIWQNNTGSYYLDKEGIIFKEAPQTEGALILKIKDFGKNNAAPGDKVLNDGILNFIIQFNNEIIARNKIKITEFEVDPAPNINFKAVTDRGWQIYLDQNQDPKSEANSLFTTLNEAVKNGEKNLAYIDLRIPTRVFYKMK